jgi:hypothetical protein
VLPKFNKLNQRFASLWGAMLAVLSSRCFEE